MHATPKGPLVPWHCSLLTKGLYAEIVQCNKFYLIFVMGIEQWNQILDLQELIKEQIEK